MDVVTSVLANLANSQDRFNSIDPIVLTSEERLSPHLLGHTKGGRKIRISLPRSAELLDGDVLQLDGNVAIVVEAAPEELFVISPTNTLDWGIVGFGLGNLHRPIRFTETSILTSADSAVAEMLDRLGISFERCITPFVGQRYGFQPRGHTHAVV